MQINDTYDRILFEKLQDLTKKLTIAEAKLEAIKKVLDS
jgi:hypothetical protein